MADDEAGFTFVDKRKVVAEGQASSVDGAASIDLEGTTEASPKPVDGVEHNDVDDSSPTDDSFSGEAPDVCMLLQYCVQLLAADAWRKMGLLADPQTGGAMMDLAQSKVAIDAVGDLVTRLESAPASAVLEPERRELKNLLNNLRLNYVNQRSANRDTAAV